MSSTSKYGHIDLFPQSLSALARQGTCILEGSFGLGRVEVPNSLCRLRENTKCQDCNSRGSVLAILVSNDTDDTVRGTCSIWKSSQQMLDTGMLHIHA